MKVFFLWLNIVEVVKSGDDLEFSVGIASANFPLDNFEVCPQCVCGLDCNGNGYGHLSILEKTLSSLPFRIRLNF